MLGLNDEHIAHVEIDAMGEGKPGHEKADGAYVLDRAPDYVMLGSSVGSRKPKFRSGRQLARLKAFRRRYALEKHRVPGVGVVRIYRRKGAARLRPAKARAR